MTRVQDLISTHELSPGAMGITIVPRAGLVARRRRFRILEAETPFNSLADCRIPNVKLPFSHNFTLS